MPGQGPDDAHSRCSTSEQTHEQGSTTPPRTIPKPLFVPHQPPKMQAVDSPVLATRVQPLSSDPHSHMHNQGTQTS